MTLATDLAEALPGLKPPPVPSAITRLHVKQTVDTWLDQVSYSTLNDGSYVPSAFALKFINFIKLVNGEEGESHESPVVHMAMLDKLAGRKTRLANLCFRGLGKTTVFIEYLFLYIAVFGEIEGFGKIDAMIYVSDSMENGVKSARKNIEFRYHNSEFLKYWLPEAHFTDNYIETRNRDGGRLGMKMFGAKALSLDSVLYAEHGPTTMKEVAVGDRIYGPDGKLAIVLEKSEVFHKPMYALRLHDGRTLKVSEDHINSVTQMRQVRTGADKGKMYFEDRDLTTSELLKYKLKVGSNYRFWVKATEPVQYPVRDLPLDPYTLGLLLGDGRIRPATGNSEIVAHRDDWAEYVQHIPYELGKEQVDNRKTNVVTRTVRGIQATIKALGMNVGAAAKRVPYAYLYGAVEQRLAMLQGLMDTDGTIGKNSYCSFCSTSPGLAEDVADLVRSLGGLAQIQLGKGYWKVGIKINLDIFRLPRKLARMRYDTRTMARVVAIDPIEQEPSQCIAIDNEERQYLTTGYTRTHNTGLRGTKIFGKRPTLAVLDDLVSDDDSRSKAAMDAIKATVYKGVDYALDPVRRKIVFNGTPFNKADILYEAVESGGWDVNVWPICERWPCTREEFNGAWGERFTYDFVKEQWDLAVATGQVASFMQELMLRIMNDEDRLVQPSEIRWYDRDQLLKNRSRFNFYITTDWSTSERKGADYTAISVWALSNNGDWFWVDGVRERQTMEKSVDELFRLVAIYRPMTVGVEVTGQQGGFVPWLQRTMLDKNCFFTLASYGNGKNPGVRPDTDKIGRFSLVVPLFKTGKIYYPEQLRTHSTVAAHVDEITHATPLGFKSKNDDCADTVSMLECLGAWRPSEDVPMAQIHDTHWGIDEEAPEEAGGYSAYTV